MDKKMKRYYKIGEMIWVIPLKQMGIVKSIDKEKLKVVVSTPDEHGEPSDCTLNLWQIDKFKEFSEEEKQIEEDFLFFAKVKENAVIPKKASDEEAGYDVWACLKPTFKKNATGEVVEVYEVLLPRLRPTLIPTGIATCVKKGFYLNFANERGSTGKLGMLVLSGIVDSSYRGEVFVNITPLFKDVLITSEVESIEEHEDIILYPYSKAICQLIDYKTGNLKPEEITYEILKSIPSSRGLKILGSSGH